MNSIRIRLIVLFIVVTATTLTVFGMYARFQLSRTLENRFSQLTHATLTRLEISVSEPMWNFDASGIFSILEAEMLQSEVNAIQVFDSQMRPFVSAARDSQGHIVAGSALGSSQGVSVETELFRGGRDAVSALPAGTQRKPLGHVVVYFSRDHIDEALHADAVRWISEALVIDTVLVLALTLSLGMVFKPLRRLRDALFDLARQGGDEVQELPETERTEFGEVIQGFNQTQRKLKQVMLRHSQAEEAARTAAAKTEQAYAELQSAQQSLLQSEKLASLGSLVAGVAHEINTPVGITLTSASVLLESTQKLQNTLASGVIRKSEIVAYTELATESVQLIVSNAERAAHLIQSFKQVAVDQTSEQRRQYALKSYLDEVMSSLHPVLRKARAQVTITCPSTIFLDGYPGAMAQVLTNLTMNALTHAFKDEAGGKIEILAELEGETVCMRFCDDGCGIAPEHLGKVFDPFFTTRRGLGGTGLGLNIVFNIMVKQFGGTITVNSALGKGSCFVLQFPRISPVTAQK
ncbi:MAG: histidine kinase [Burkholderiales bacterium RIFCSPLOWO2_12_FULL_61_40]|nr:MAG: histidine kinase [Burkholderiales bacterium RIFCSPLOWO2_12_FULL_61_40]